MITSVGRDLAHACASIRAGISRPRDIDYFEVLDPETQDMVPLVGSPIRAYTEGFTLVGLWIRIAKGCLLNLVQRSNLPDKSHRSFWQESALIGVTPYIDDDRFLSKGNETPDLIKEAYLYPLHEYLDLPILIKNLYTVCMGHTGTITAIAMAESLISSSDIRRVIILAVDSYLDRLTLEWLAKYERLKSAANPTGLAPGEAGACFLLESASTCEQRNTPFLAAVESVGLEKESQDFFSGEINRGVGLSRAIEQALRNAPIELPFIGDLISDQNGENWRACELAGARILLHNKVSPLCSLVLPGISIGDVGAASGAVSLCIAVQSLVRHYSSGDRTLVLTSSEHGHVGAACVKRAV